MNAREWPSEFESGMKSLLGSEWPAFLQSLAESPPTSIRINPAKPCGVDVDTPVPWTQFGAYLPVRPAFTLDPRLPAGPSYVQQASSMSLEHAAPAHAHLEKSPNVPYPCPAPGGNTTPPL